MAITKTKTSWSCGNKYKTTTYKTKSGTRTATKPVKNVSSSQRANYQKRLARGRG